MRTLPGQELGDSDYAELLSLVDRLVFDAVFRPVIDLVRPQLPKPVAATLAPRAMASATREELLNAAADEARAALERALRSGAVQAISDPKGKRAMFAVAKPDRRISDALRSFGCRINNTTGMWECAPAQVPAWVRAEASSYEVKARAAHDAIRGLLDDLEGKIDQVVEQANLSKGIDHAVGEVARGWKDSAKQIQVVPNLSEVGEAALRRAFQANARIPIKRMAKESIKRLRAQVDANAMQGYRARDLADRIRNEYGVTKSRADMIARQETSNFMAAYREARATDAGLRRYVWTIAGGIRTRPGHKAIDGRIFTYAQKAPAKYMSFGIPCNPGEDARCRCVDRPVIE